MKMTLRQRKKRRQDAIGLGIFLISVAMLALGMAIQYSLLTAGS